MADRSLLDAIAAGDVDAARTLLVAGASPNVQSAGGYSAWTLLLASWDALGAGELLRLLVDHGADVAARESETGRTGLMVAATLGDAALVSALLERGADPMATDASGSCAIAYAASLDVFDCLKDAMGEKLPESATETALFHRLVAKGDVDGALQIVQAGRIVDRTALAAGWGRAALGTLPERELRAVLGALGHDDLDLALGEHVSGGEDPARVRALLALGARPDTMTVHGPVLLLARTNEGFHALLEGGADPNARGPGGKTALMQAAERCDVERIARLLERGADLTLKDDDGRDAGRWASRWPSSPDREGAHALLRKHGAVIAPFAIETPTTQADKLSLGMLVLALVALALGIYVLRAVGH